MDAAYSDHGDPECCDLIFPVQVGDRENFTCNEWGVIRSVPEADARKVLYAMEAHGPLSLELCPYCGVANYFGVMSNETIKVFDIRP